MVRLKVRDGNENLPHLGSTWRTVPNSSFVQVLEVLLVLLLSHLKGILVSVPTLSPVLSIIVPSMQDSAYDVPPIQSMDPSITLTFTYGTLLTPCVITSSVLVS